MEQGNLVGPLHTKSGVKQYVDGLKTIEKIIDGVYLT
jgi:hypothetical protein